MEELNEKLAEWAGFEWVKAMFKWGCYDKSHWSDPNNGWHDELPDFTQSLDACFKWLVPKLEERDGFHGISFSLSGEGCICEVMETWYRNTSEAETPALALCKAIEKLIDGEKNA